MSRAIRHIRKREESPQRLLPETLGSSRRLIIVGPSHEATWDY